MELTKGRILLELTKAMLCSGKYTIQDVQKELVNGVDIESCANIITAYEDDTETPNMIL